eukprot:CAMPEP_0185174652 /NCGR_PEP_ID=MMETSP1139-20130426/25596_1 /TAXON_ID=298111 /ORGANISM="Pavlova sp., Strain CCMP459" /LENGTH=68 /DNA_ID=CAMNT_0027740373 /DNA_START=27 /DNA_END=229 /DNA_ORIENTATION=-
MPTAAERMPHGKPHKFEGACGSHCWSATLLERSEGGAKCAVDRRLLSPDSAARFLGLDFREAFSAALA